MSDSLTLTSGLHLHRAGTSIETVHSRHGDIGLRLKEPGVELIELSLRAGDRLTIVPARERQDSGTEVYYLLTGSLSLDVDGAEALGPNDIIVAQDLQVATVFTVKSTVRILCVTTRPTFHEVSAVIQDLMRLADEVELKDKGSAEHCARVGHLALRMGKKLGLPDDRLLRLDYGAYLHDIGKVKVPQEILLKPSRLTDNEWQIIKEHPIYGRQMVENTAIKDVSPIIEQHHERLDGSGYPYGIAGDEILTESYIVAVADAFDAMTKDRPYHAAVSQQHAVAEIERGSERFYPREVVKAFLSSVEDANRS